MLDFNAQNSGATLYICMLICVRARAHTHTQTHTNTHTQVAEARQDLHSAETDEPWRLPIVVDTNVTAIFLSLKSTPYSDFT